MLETKAISVRFGGHDAVRDVDLMVPAGSVTGLIGPNGAGKTTTFNVITGLQEPTRGRVLFDGRDVSGLRPYRRARLGIARTFQRLELFGSMTARENVLTAAEVRRRWSGERVDPARVTTQALARVGLLDRADERVDAMPTGQARLVELARALATGPRLLLLDEPASGQDEQETEAFGALLGQLAAEGMGILMVEHDMSLVMRVCARVYVLDFGAVLASGSPDEVQRNPAVLEAYLGAATEQEAVR